MKVARSQSSELVDAGPKAPLEAFCMYCGGSVVLRKKTRVKSGGVSYFWRHADNSNHRCRGRNSLTMSLRFGWKR